MNKTVFSFILFALILLSSCKTDNVIYDLIEEAPFGREQGDIFAVDLLEPEGEPYVMGGWSPIRKDGTRLGVFPLSRLSMPLFDNQPLYLYLKCQPFERDRFPAQGFRFLVRKEEIARVELEAEDRNVIKVRIPPLSQEWEGNVLQIHHVVDKGSRKGVEPEENKRIRTAVFHEMLLSSHADYGMTQRYIKMKKRVKDKSSGVMIQKVPSARDFFFDLSPGARMEARFEFIAAEPSQIGATSSVTVSLTQEGEKEEIIHLSPLKENEARTDVELDLPVRKKAVSRLRIQAGEGQETDSLIGLMVWKKAVITGRPEKEKRKDKKPPELSDAFLNWKKLLAGKNTVLIILDAARADHFSSFGYFRQTTPNLDEFAQEAVLFAKAYSEALSTRTSMGILFTGFPLTVLSLYNITSQLPDELATLAGSFQGQKIKTAGFAGVGNVGSNFGFHRGFDQYFELYKEEAFYRKSQEYLPYVLPWLEANKDNRFFLYVHFKEPHAFYNPLPPFKGMFTDAYQESVDLSGEMNLNAVTLTDGQIEYVRAAYDENLASVDSVVGEIIAKMRSLGLLDESIIIVTADHGELLGEIDNMFGHGSYFGEGGMHIPLLIRFPENEKIDYPSHIDALVKTSDVFVTLADIYGFSVPGDLTSGKSLLPLIRKPDAEINPFMVSEKRGLPGYCYRTAEHKLIYWMGNAPVEFYDLENDPQALENVYEQNKILAHYYLTDLKKWIASQKLIKDIIFERGSSRHEIDMREIDEKTLENLKALGYIK